MAGGSADAELSSQLNILSRLGVVGDHADGQLIQRFLTATDETAEAVFTVLVERHGPMVLRVCRQVLGDPHEAQDAFQATFLVLARKAGSVRKADSVASWLHGVALRVAARARDDAARRRRYERRVAAMKAAEPEVTSVPRESWPELHDEIARLPERYREPVVLCYLEGLSTEAAALRIGCPKGTVLSRLSRARERLRGRLIRQGMAIPAVLIAEGLASDTVTAAIPPALLEATVKASLGFAGRRVSGAAVASAAANQLARGVISAMTTTKLKMLGAFALASLLAIGGAQTLAFQFGGLGEEEKAERAEPKDEDRHAALARSVERLQVQLEESDRRNATLRKALQEVQAELKALRPASQPAVAKVAGKSALPLSFDVAFPVARPRIQKLDHFVFVTSTYGERVILRNTYSDQSHTLTLDASKEFPLSLELVAANPGVALAVKGPRITRIAVADNEGKWFPQDLREPFAGEAIPQNGPQATAYVLGRYVYAFSNPRKRWGVIKLPDGMPAKLEMEVTSITIQGQGHILTFSVETGTWSDLDADTLLKDSKTPEADPTSAPPR